MSSSPKMTTADSAFQASPRTDEGLPLDPRFGAALATVDLGEGGPARRVDCQPLPQLLSPPSLRRHVSKESLSAPSFQTFSPKAQPPELWRSSPLVAGPIEDSLMDDDDELVDYFGTPLTSPDSTAIEDATSSSISRWRVHEHNVRTLPLFYPLEKSSVFVPQASASILAARIADILQARSIAASFDARNAKVDCVTQSHVEFRIRLYRGRGEFSHGIIIEVQRRAGFDFSYAHDVSAILDAVEGKAEEKYSVEISPTFYEETKGGDDTNLAENSGGIEALRIISGILCPKDSKNEVPDEGRELAMASLASLTSLDRTGHAAAHISNELLTFKAHADLRRYVLSQASQDRSQTSMTRSLEILANVANHYPSQLAELLVQDNHDILVKLAANIENARSDPHAADLSCVILRAVVEESTLREHAERLIMALLSAVHCGGEGHAGLQRHSQNLLERIV